MDTPAPPTASAPRDAAPYVYAATEYRPRGAHETELCERASHFDWLYEGALVLLDAGAITLDATIFQGLSQPGVRLIGPGLVGLSWGATVGGGYLAFPKCAPDFMGGPPPEGEVHTDWPAAAAFALLAGATAPVLVGIETGTGLVTADWPVWKRSMRLVVAGTVGAGGALLPYLIPPTTWGAAKELRHLRGGGDARGAFVTYTLSF